MIKNITIKIPTSWEDVTLKQFQLLSELDEKEDKSKYFNNFLRILLDVDDKTLKSFTLEGLQKISKELNKWTDKEIGNDYVHPITFKKKTYTYNKEWNQLSIGEMVSLETIMDNYKLSYYESMVYVVTLLLRETLNGKEEEFDSVNLINRKELFEEIPITYVYKLIFDFFKWRKNLYGKEFKGLFPQKVKEEPMKNQVKKPNTEPEFPTRWNWFMMIEKLAMGDITKFKDVYKQNFISCLNLLSFWKEKDDYVAKMERRQAARDKARNRF